LLTLMIISLIPAVVMVLAGAVTLVRIPGANFQSSVLHFAAGVVFAIVAAEFIPDLVHENRIIATAIGFSIGTASMLVIRSATKVTEEAKQALPKGVAWGLLTGTGIDLAVDGLMLGIGFASGGKVGLLLTIALTIELLSLGIATTVSLLGNTVPRRKIMGILILLSFLFVFGAALGGGLAKSFSGDIFAGFVAFGTAALLFLVTEELLTEAHEIEESPLLTATFFVGFLVIFILEMLVSASPEAGLDPKTGDGAPEAIITRSVSKGPRVQSFAYAAGWDTPTSCST